MQAPPTRSRALEHEDALAVARQVRRGGEPVMAAADDDDVPVARRQLGDRAGEAQLAELLGDGAFTRCQLQREVTTFLRV